MMLLAIDWTLVGVKAGQLILALSILVILHEFGHFITARWFGCRVEKFYLFFDPWFSLFKKKVGDTEYGVGWLPLGGYVKIAGMVDESMDTEALKAEPQAWEFRSKPAWQRLIIMLGGIIMNVLVAILIFAMVLFVWGEEKIPVSSMKYGISFQDTVFQQIGFQQGDKIISVDGKPVDYTDKLTYQVITGTTAEVERNGERVSLQFPESLLGDLVSRKKNGLLSLDPRVPAILGSFEGLNETTPAMKAGLQGGDKIVSVNQIPVTYFDEIRSVLLQANNDTVQVQYERNGQLQAANITMNEERKIGILPLIYFPELMDSLGIIKVEHKAYNLFEALPGGVAKTGEKLSMYVAQFKKILNPKTGAYKGLGGFKAIANAFPGVWNWEAFWNMTGFLSIVLAFMNLLPIPALDGGHVMFTLYEMITGRKPHEKVLEYAQIAGMIFLLILMVYANANDWLGWGR
jgi:regulator of sigma E protease